MASLILKEEDFAAAGAEDQFTYAERLWGLLVITLPLDFLLAGNLGAWLLRNYNPELLAFGIFIFALLLASREIPLRALSYLRKLKYAVAEGRRTSRLKAALVLGAVILLSTLEVMIHAFKLSWGAAGIAAFVLAVAAVSAVRFHKDMNAWNSRLAVDAYLSAEVANKENLVMSTLPIVLLRIAALAAAVALLAQLTLASALLYGAVLLSFQRVHPQRNDFFQRCRRCAGKFPRTVMDNTVCPVCARRR